MGRDRSVGRSIRGRGHRHRWARCRDTTAAAVRWTHIERWARSPYGPAPTTPVGCEATSEGYEQQQRQSTTHALAARHGREREGGVPVPNRPAQRVPGVMSAEALCRTLGEER